MTSSEPGSLDGGAVPASYRPVRLHIAVTAGTPCPRPSYPAVAVAGANLR